MRAQADELRMPIVPIPGTKRIKWLENNVAALDVHLDDETVQRLAGLDDVVVGDRYGAR